MDLLNGVLDTVERPGLGALDLAHEARGQVLLDNSIRACEETQNVPDEILFVLGELDPVLHILAQIHLLGNPHDATVILVFGKELGLEHGKQGKPVRIGDQDGLHEGVGLRT